MLCEQLFGWCARVIPVGVGLGGWIMDNAPMTETAETFIDLNADLGEHPDADGIARDIQMLAQISSASIACGGHAGDARSMARVSAAARALDVRIGAHVGYADAQNFGRKELNLGAAEIGKQVQSQLHALLAHAKPDYLKPHGALYHRVMRDAAAAEAVLDAVADCGLALPVLGLRDSAFFRSAASRDWRTVSEGFADRGYDDDGQLLPRDQPGAVLTDVEQMSVHALRLIRSGQVRSLCLHGDTPGALQAAQALRQRLMAEGVQIRSFV